MSPRPNIGKLNNANGDSPHEKDQDEYQEYQYQDIQDYQEEGVITSVEMENDDNYENMGYQPLPQGPDGMNTDDEDDEELDLGSILASANITSEVSEDKQSCFTNEEIKERKELWKTARDDKDIMNEDDANKIKSLMKGFSLPANHMPIWANEIPEEKWISDLLSKLGDKR